MGTANSAGAGNNNAGIDSIILPAERRVHQPALLRQTMRKAGAVWNNFILL